MPRKRKYRRARSARISDSRPHSTARSRYCGMPVATDTSRTPRVPRASLQHAPSELHRMMSALWSSARAGRSGNESTSARRSSRSSNWISSAVRTAVRLRDSFRSNRASAEVGFMPVVFECLQMPVGAPRILSRQSSTRWTETRSLEARLTPRPLSRSSSSGRSNVNSTSSRTNLLVRASSQATSQASDRAQWSGHGAGCALLDRRSERPAAVTGADANVCLVGTRCIALRGMPRTDRRRSAAPPSPTRSSSPRASAESQP